MPGYESEARRTFLITTEFDCWWTGPSIFYEGTNDMLDDYDDEHAPTAENYFYGDITNHHLVVVGFSKLLDRIRNLPEPNLDDVLKGGTL